MPYIVTLAVAAMLLFLFFYLRSRHIGRTQNIADHVDALIGEKVVVTEKIENVIGRGQVKLSRNGQGWSARAVTDETEYDVGEILHVVAVEGVKLICKK